MDDRVKPNPEMDSSLAQAVDLEPAQERSDGDVWLAFAVAATSKLVTRGPSHTQVDGTPAIIAAADALLEAYRSRFPSQQPRNRHTSRCLCPACRLGRFNRRGQHG